MIRDGSRIINARCVPGTLGCVARSLSDGAAVALTAHHVLFGAGARAQEAVRSENGETIGRALYGRIGIVNFEGLSYYIDCALSSLGDDFVSLSKARAFTSAQPGERVTKLGAATGLTTGIVADVDYSESVVVDGRSHQAPRQLLMRSAIAGQRFSEEGDSGAVVCNAHGELVGLLWGTSAAGDAVACHIAPVFHVLHLRS